VGLKFLTTEDQHRQILGLLRRHRCRLWRTWELKEQLRDLVADTVSATLTPSQRSTCVWAESP
jgi:hypothetical protein